MTNNGLWIKASASSGSGECVEMRQVGEAVQVRDSKLGTASPIHTLTRSTFSVWLTDAKAGKYDALGG